MTGPRQVVPGPRCRAQGPHEPSAEATSDVKPQERINRGGYPLRFKIGSTGIPLVRQTAEMRSGGTASAGCWRLNGAEDTLAEFLGADTIRHTTQRRVVCSKRGVARCAPQADGLIEPQADRLIERSLGR